MSGPSNTMADEASERERERERERRKSLAAKLPMAEVEKHMAEIGLSNKLTQDELRTCRDGAQAHLIHAIFDAFSIPLPTGPQDPVHDPEGLPLDSSGKPQPRPGGQAGYLERLFSPQPPSQGVQAEWVRLAKLTGWKGSEKTGAEDELCGAALHLTLFNQDVDTDHPEYKKLYDVGLVAKMHNCIRKKQAVSRRLVKDFEWSWLGRKDSSGSTAVTYVDPGWIPGSELELRPHSFEQEVTKYLMARLVNNPGPENWYNKPPESSPIVQPPGRPQAVSATSDEASIYSPSDPESTGNPANLTPAPSGSAQPSVEGTADDSNGKGVRRDKATKQILWDISTESGQRLDDWLLDQNRQGQTMTAMGRIVKIQRQTISSRLYKLAEEQSVASESKATGP